MAAENKNLIYHTRKQKVSLCVSDPQNLRFLSTKKRRDDNNKAEYKKRVLTLNK